MAIKHSSNSDGTPPAILVCGPLRVEAMSKREPAYIVACCCGLHAHIRCPDGTVSEDFISQLQGLGVIMRLFKTKRLTEAQAEEARDELAQSSFPVDLTARELIETLGAAHDAHLEDNFLVVDSAGLILPPSVYASVRRVLH
jgi:hypothetical protein